jgi:glycosyltransferase involved in cell wall biosynthesis
MTTDTLGGVFSYATSLASWLSSQGVEVTLATMGANLTASQRAAAEQAGARVRESTYRLEWMQEPWDDVRRAGDWLLALEGELRPDVVHLNGYAHAALGWRAPVRVVAHSCVCSWFRAVREERAPNSWSRYREAVALALSAARVIAPTRALLKALHHEYGRLRDGEVIYNGVPLPRRVQFSVKEPLVLCAGRLWDPAKNIGALQAAAHAVPWPIRAAGEASAPEGGANVELTALSLLGTLSRAELGNWMERAAIFAAPALYEPFGLSILEAAGRCCALVLGDIPSLRELWDNCALFVDPRDPGALAAALKRLIAESALRQALAERAYLRAQSYDLERMGRAYLRSYGFMRMPSVARAAELHS